MPEFEDNLDRVVGAYPFVILLQVLSKPVCLNAHNGILALIEIRTSSEDFSGEGIFLNSI
jgi:hypothetical protein